MTLFACPANIDQAKWAPVAKQLAALHDALAEANEEHLGHEAVTNSINDAIIATRKLGVELEVCVAHLRRASKKQIIT